MRRGCLELVLAVVVLAVFVALGVLLLLWVGIL